LFFKAKQESFHLCYFFKKIIQEDDHSTLQVFLDQQQYSKTGVLRYEKIFGPGFVSTGGLDTTKVCLIEKKINANNHNSKNILYFFVFFVLGIC